MSTNALNQVYKTAILAVEEATLTANVAVAETHIPITIKSMSASPIVAGDGSTYVLRDNGFDSVNAAHFEQIQIVSIGTPVATPLSDGIGYTYTAILTILGYDSALGWSGGIKNTYSVANQASILLPGVEMAITSADFNCRFKTLTDAPKIDMDDEASRFATGDEGRDRAIAGARSGEITFTEKLAWAGNVYTVPVWNKILRTQGHVLRMYRMPTGIYGASYSNIAGLVSTFGFNVGDEIYCVDATDTIDLALATAKGGALAAGDAFIIASATTVTYTTTSVKAVSPTTYATVALLKVGASLGIGDRFFTVDGTDTTDDALAAAKGTAITTGDVFEILTLTTCKYVANPITGMVFWPMTQANEVTATIWIIAPENGSTPSNTVWRYVGAHGGNSSSIAAGKIGDPYMLTGKYSAAYLGTMELTNAQTRVITAVEQSTPEVLLSNTCLVPTRIGNSTTTKNIEISQFTLDFGGVINPFINQATTTGNAYYATQDRDPKFTCNPYHVRKALDDIDYLVTNMVVGTIIMKSGITSPHMTITIPATQLTQAAIASREGYVNTNRTYRCLRNDLGNGAVYSDMPNQLMYEILIGAKS
jgi:hypothetical protein